MNKYTKEYYCIACTARVKKVCQTGITTAVYRGRDKNQESCSAFLNVLFCFIKNMKTSGVSNKGILRVPAQTWKTALKQRSEYM